jgi:hypothetical protein
MDDAIDHGLRRGALAVGMGINYAAGATHGEIVDVFKIAAAHGASVHVHLCYNGLLEPTTGLAALQEVIADSAATGAPLHVVHITSMGMRETPRLLEMIRGAQKRGLDVTTEAYPTSQAALDSIPQSLTLAGRSVWASPTKISNG